MTAPTIKMRCPQCRNPAPARWRKGVWALTKHGRSKFHSVPCVNVTITAEQAVENEAFKRSREQMVIDNADRRREDARAAYAAQLSLIDADVTEARENVEDHDATLAILRAKLTTKAKR
jgi:hypothetical protein